MSDFLDQFRSALSARGILPPEQIVTDGCIHRCDAEGKRGKNDASYLLHADKFPAGGFINYRDGRSWQTWHADLGRTLTTAERAQHAAVVEAAKEKRVAEDVQRRASAKQKAEAMLSVSRECVGHPYLIRKEIKPSGARLYKDNLLILPLRDAAGQLHTIQTIDADGNKRFLSGGRKSGCFMLLGEVKADSVICIVEGFATGASIHEATWNPVVVAMDANNLQSVAASIRAKHPEHKILICADDDVNDVGITKAREAARAVGGQVVLPDFGSDRPADVTDFNDLFRCRGFHAVMNQISVAASSPILEKVVELAKQDLSQRGETSSAKSEPESLRRPLHPPAAYPQDALGPILGAAAARIHAVVGAPVAMVGQSVLAAASLAVQHHADVSIDGRQEPLSLWCLTISESGERKSAVDHLALKAHREHERIAIEAYKLAKHEYDMETKAFDAATRGSAKGKDIDCIENDLRMLGQPPEAPLKPLLIVSSPTIEGLHKQYWAGLPSLGLFHDDAAEFLSGHSMNKENRAKTASGLSKLWDNGEFDRVRAGDGAEKAYGKRLALHLMVQPVIAETVLGDEVLAGQGFLARCLIAWPTSTIGTRQYVQVDLTGDPALVRYWRLLHNLLETQPRLRQDTRNELEPRTLTLTVDAKDRWISVHEAIEKGMREEGAYSTVRAWASKSPAQVLRIAGVLALIENPETGVIDLDKVDRASRLATHYLSEAVRSVGTTSVPKEIRNAELLLEWCRASGIHLLHSRAALRLGPTALRSVKDFDKAIKVLHDYGWAGEVEGGTQVDGKHRKRVWRITSAL
jgi:putative DNA primase/helicase